MARLASDQVQETPGYGLSEFWIIFMHFHQQ
jgi:hypothetical protein